MVIEFDNVAAARAAFETEEYLRYSKARARAGSVVSGVVVEGV